MSTTHSSEQERAEPFLPINAQSTVDDTSTQSAGYMATAEMLPTSDDMGVVDDSSNYLNWPDSADLLNSILSAEFVTLPSLEILPSQPMLRAESPPAATSHSSPWLSLRDQQSSWLEGENAVQSLSQIINNSVLSLPGYHAFC
jgi:hypothetical protein